MYSLNHTHGASADDMVLEPEDAFFEQPAAHDGGAAVQPVDLRALYNLNVANAAAPAGGGESESGAPGDAKMRDEEPNAPMTNEEEDLLSAGPFRLDTPVALHGLIARPELNGQRWRVASAFNAATGRNGVRLDGPADGKPLALNPQNLRPAG